MGDRESGGQPALHTEARRFVSFLVVGGTSTILNLAIVFLISTLLRWPYIPTALVAYEAGILYSFVLMDTLTFSALSRAAGGWVARCLRFHSAYIVGVALTLGLAEAFQLVLHWPEVVAHAVALAIATVVNFATIRFWAYRGRGGAERPMGAVPPPRHQSAAGPAAWPGHAPALGVGPRPPLPSDQGANADYMGGRRWEESPRAPW